MSWKWASKISWKIEVVSWSKINKWECRIFWQHNCKQPGRYFIDGISCYKIKKKLKEKKIVLYSFLLLQCPATEDCIRSPCWTFLCSSHEPLNITLETNRWFCVLYDEKAHSYSWKFPAFTEACEKSALWKLAVLMSSPHSVACNMTDKHSKSDIRRK